MSKEREALVDSALDRMAENARELGLDYEPPCKTGSQCTNKCQQCEQPAPVPEAHKQQRPVAWMHTNAIGHVYFRKNPQDKTLNPVPLYTSPPANTNAGKPWVGLTRDERMSIINRLIGQDWVYALDAIEAKLKEKNT